MLRLGAEHLSFAACTLHENDTERHRLYLEKSEASHRAAQDAEVRGRLGAEMQALILEEIDMLCARPELLQQACEVLQFEPQHMRPWERLELPTFT